MDLITLLLTSLLSIAALFIIAKFMGHKQLSQLDFFDYITGITIGSIAAELATELDEPWKPLISMLVYGAVSLLLNLISHRFPRARKYINGTPTVLMNGGKIYKQNLRRAKLDLNEFLLLCRELGYFDLSDIQTAVFEENGHLSILPKSVARPLTPRDVEISTPESEISIELIMDGHIISENLARLEKGREWLTREIKKAGYEDEKDIFLAVFNCGKLTFYGMN